MNKNQQFKYQVIIDFLQGNLRQTEAAELLHISRRTVTRLARRIEARGFLGVIHGNKGKPARNRISDEHKTKVMAIFREKYFDCNMTHAHELLLLEQNIEVSYGTFRRWCSSMEVVKQRRRRKRARVFCPRMPAEGMLLQLDGSPHRYNGKDEWCLIGAIDDATSDIPYAEFFRSEDTISCMKVLKKIIELKGIPYAIYTDHAGWFGGLKRQNSSQFKRACEELGIHVIFAHTPESKGRIERAWKTIQDRIIPELRMLNIETIDRASSHLQETFLKNYWGKKNKVAPRSSQNKYRRLSGTTDLNQIFCLKEYRVIRGDRTVSWNNKIYLVKDADKLSVPNQRIEIRTYIDYSWRAFFAGNPIQLSPLVANNEINRDSEVAA